MSLAAQPSRRSLFLAALALIGLIRLAGFVSPIFMDEAHILQAVAHFVSNRTILPPWHDWPPLFAYLAVPATGLVSILGGAANGLSPVDWALLHGAFVDQALALGIRFLSLMFAVLTAAVLWKAAPGLTTAPSRSSTRLAAMLVYAFSPMAARYGGWGLPETGLGLGVACVLWKSLRYLENQREKDLVWAGAFVGLAAAFKYNGALSGFAVACAAVLGGRGGSAGDPARALLFGRSLRRLLYAAGVALSVFLILTPTWLLAPDHAIRGFLFETRNVASEVIGCPVGRYWSAPGLLLRHEPGWLLGAAFGVLALWKGAGRRAGVAMSLMAANYLIVGGWARQDPNYWMPSLPAASLLFAEGVAALASSRRAFLACGVSSVVLAVALWRIAPPPLSTDNCGRMRSWLAVHLPREAEVVRDGGYTPKIWASAQIEEFWAGQGNLLSEKGKAEFYLRLERHPQAFRVDTVEGLLARSSGRPLDGQIPPGAWLLTTQETLDRILHADPPKDPQLRQIHEIKKQFYDRLLDPAGSWRMVHDERRGSGSAQMAFQKGPTS